MEPRYRHFTLVFWLLSSSIDTLFFMCQHFMQMFGYYLQVSTLYIFMFDTFCWHFGYYLQELALYFSYIDTSFWLLFSSVDSMAQQQYSFRSSPITSVVSYDQTSGRTDLFWLSPVRAPCCGLPTQRAIATITTEGSTP